MSKVTAIVRALNEEEHIGRLLVGLSQQSKRIDELILVDSGSTDATVKIAQRFGARVVHIAPEEFSFGRSLNRGCERASGDLLLIVSAHVYPPFESFIELLSAPFHDPEVLLTYGRQVGDHRTQYSESRLMLKWFPPESEARQTHAFANNASCMVRRSTWESLRYDEHLTGLEDVEFAERVLASEGAISYVAEAAVAHVHQESWARLRLRYEREALAYRRITRERQFGLLGAIGLAAMNAASDYSHAARDGVLLSNLASIPRFRSAQFLGAWRGTRGRLDASRELHRRFYYPLPSNRTRADSVGTGKPIDYDAIADSPIGDESTS